MQYMVAEFLLLLENHSLIYSKATITNQKEKDNVNVFWNCT